VGGKTRAFEHSSSRSYLSSCEPTVVIGLGAGSTIDRLTVYWPSGRTTELRGVKAGTVEVREP